MTGSIQMVAGLAVVLGIVQAFKERSPKPLLCLALPGLAIWLILGWLSGWETPD